MKEVMDITDARNVIKDLQEKQFICSQYTIETESGYVITTKSKRPYCKPKKQTKADRIRSMSDEELAEFLADPEKFSPCKNCDFHFVDAMNDDCKVPDGWICTKGYASAFIQKWLQSEVE